MRGRLVMGVLLTLAFLSAGAARAEQAWVRGELSLNLRTGPGTAYRIMGTLGTGDAVNVLARRDNWTQISTDDGSRGWIPAGYLNKEPPPTLRLAQAESELVELREQLGSTTAEAATLREENERLSTQDTEQQEEIRRLTEENLHLKAGERWPYLITGATILTAGMLAGALLYRTSARRPQPRIRL